MARVKRKGTERLSVQIFIAEPLGILLLPFQGCGCLCSVLTFASFGYIVEGTTPPGQRGAALEWAFSLAGVTTVLLLIGSFSLQRFVADRRSNSWKTYRSFALLSRRPLDEISHLELQEYADGDGGAWKATLHLSDGSMRPINRVATAGGQELRVLADEMNAFLGAARPRGS